MCPEKSQFLRVLISGAEIESTVSLEHHCANEEINLREQDLIPRQETTELKFACVMKLSTAERVI